MSLTDKLRKDMFTASKEGRTFESDILKIVLSAIKNEEVKKGSKLEDIDVEKILRTEVKKIKDSISQYKDMDRNDLADEEKKQLEVIEKYLPELMSEEDVKKVVEEKASQLAVSSMNDMGKLMGAVMQDLNGKADGALVKQVVQDVLK